MSEAATALAVCITRAYGEQADPAFAGILRDARVNDDNSLADLIELDGRTRLEAGLKVDIQRYLAAVPDLTKRRIALDASIEFAIRSGCRAGLSEEQAAAKIVAERPDLASAVSLAVTLGEGVCSTTSLHRALIEPDAITLPQDFGPVLEDGRARYDLRQFLGSGAQGRVYSAVDRTMSEPDRPAFVAVKILRTVSDDPRWRDLFVEEGLKARRISHPNVVRVLDRGTDAKMGDYVVYEQVDGGSLASLIGARRGPLEARAAAGLIAKVCRGMHAVHLAGLLHCDLKPSNVLLTREGEPKVADFGAAARLREVPGVPTPERIGNLMFMAPEQLRTMDRVLAVTADVYALGGLLHYVLTGTLPERVDLPSKHAPAGATGANAHLPKSPRDLNPRVDGDLDAICRRAMAHDPADRHGSADALAADLETWLALRPIGWARPRASHRARLFLRRQPGTAMVGVFGLLLALGASGAGVYIAMSGRERVLNERLAAAARLEAEQEASKLSISNAITAFDKAIMGQDHEGITAEWLLPGFILESVAGPALFNPRADANEMWSRRTAIAEDILTAAEKAGQADSLESLWWRDALAFWSIRAGDYTRADAMLAAGDGAWERILKPDDWWRTVRSTLKACVQVQRFEAAAAAKKPPAGKALEETADRLARLLTEIDRRPASESLHLLNLSHQARLFGPELLNDERRAAAVRERLAEKGAI